MWTSSLAPSRRSDPRELTTDRRDLDPPRCDFAQGGCAAVDVTLRKRRPRRRAIGTRAPILMEAKVNARWSREFVHVYRRATGALTQFW
jgi:hypothetical protein